MQVLDPGDERRYEDHVLEAHERRKLIMQWHNIAQIVTVIVASLVTVTLCIIMIMLVAN